MNCRHLANANKFDHVRRVNTMMGLFVPALVTPLELVGFRGFILLPPQGSVIWTFAALVRPVGIG